MDSVQADITKQTEETAEFWLRIEMVAKKPIRDVKVQIGL